MMQDIVRPTGWKPLFLGLVALAATGCRQEAPPPEPPENVQLAEPAVPAPREPFTPPIPIPPADRETLLIASLRAASAAAAGSNDRAEQDSLAGQRFVVRERFGCAGPATEGTRRWTYDEDSGAIRVHFEPAPNLAPDEPPAKDEADAEADAPAAYSIAYPWLLTAGCTAQRAEAAPTAGGNVVLTQVFTEDDSRADRLPEIFRAVKRIAPDEVPANGLEFVLSGRLEEDEDGRVIRCSARVPGTRPDCRINVSIDGARIEEPGSGLEIAEWGSS